MEGEGTLSISIDKSGVCRWRFHHHYEKTLREDGERSTPLRKADLNLWMTYRNGFLAEVNLYGRVVWPEQERPERFLGVPVPEDPVFTFELLYRQAANREFLLQSLKTTAQDEPVIILDPTKAAATSVFPLAPWGFELLRDVYKFRYINGREETAWFEFPSDLRRAKRLEVVDG